MMKIDLGFELTGRIAERVPKADIFDRIFVDS